MKKLITLALILAASSAFAGGSTPPRAEAEADARAHANGEGGDANATGGHANAQGGESNAAGGEANASADGSNNSTTNNENDSDFFALSTTFPQVSGCFKGAQGGAGGGGGALWFGRHGLDLDCFYAQIAEAEPEIEVQARLKCGSKAYRNAIAYDVKDKPRGTRQRACVDYMTAKHRDELERLRATANSYEMLLHDRDTLRDRLEETERTLLMRCQEAEEAGERANDAWLECQKGK